MIRRIVNSLYHRYNRCPRPGQWFTTSYPLVMFQSGKMFKRLGGAV
ncbi:TPA: hypothetical protein IGZ65_004725 [Escherichia coli]|nr:hypothetical protein [Escherichia coli]